MPHWKPRRHPYFFQMVADGGFEGIRVVRKGGVILWMKSRFQCDRLIPYVGLDVWVQDNTQLTVFEGGFDSKNRPLFLPFPTGMPCICSERLSGDWHLETIPNPDALRADHMAEMHVGEPNESCDLCEQ